MQPLLLWCTHLGFEVKASDETEGERKGKIVLILSQAVLASDIGYSSILTIGL